MTRQICALRLDDTTGCGRGWCGRVQMAAEALYWSARVDDPQSEHGPTTYRVTVTTNVPAYSSSLTPITSRRRYTEFCELRDCLAERQAAEGVVPSTLPVMPPKKLWSTAPGVVSTRCAVFEELLNAIGKDERLRLLPVVAAFVCAQPFPARLPTAALPATLPAQTKAPAAPKPRTAVKPLFQDDPVGDENAGTSSKRQEAVQCVLDAPEALTTPSRRHRVAIAAEGVVDLTLCGVTDAPLTREQKAAEEAAHAARETAAREAAAEQVQLAARLQAAAKAKAEAEAQAHRAAEAAKEEARLEHERKLAIERAAREEESRAAAAKAAADKAAAAKEAASAPEAPATTVYSAHAAAEPLASPRTVAPDTVAPASKPAWQPPAPAASKVAAPEPADPLGATSIATE